MLKKYRQGFNKILNDKGYSLGLFRIEENTNDGKELVISIPETQLRFEVTRNKDNFHEFCCLFTKFAPIPSDYGRAPTDGWASIESIYNLLIYWLDNQVKIYFEEKGIANESLFVIEEKQDEVVDIEALLKERERNDLEVKGSITLNLNRLYKGDGKTETKPEIALDGVLKTIVAYLNSSGGQIIVGAIEKSKFPELELRNHPEVSDYYLIGAEIEFDKSGFDGYELRLRNLIDEHIAKHLAGIISIEPVSLKNRSLCRINVSRVFDRWYYLDGDKFYVRDGNRTVLLQGQDADNYKALRSRK